MNAYRLRALGLAVLLAPSAWAQTSSSAPPVSSETLEQTQRNQAKKGKVVLERSIDENGQTVDGPTDTAAKPAAGKPRVAAAKSATPPDQARLSIDDAERSALTESDFDLDVRLRPREGHMAVRALVTVRNDGKSPLAHLPLQISSELNWEIVRMGGHPVAFSQHTVNSDADHTGQLHEALVELPAPLAPGASRQLDVTYSGTITQSLKRLLAIGTPQAIAAQSDWDRVAADFTGLRGFGNVVWYPVSSVPVILGDGAKLFDEIGTHKLRLAGAHFRLALTVEAPAAEVPNLAVVNGRPVKLFAAAGSGAATDPDLPTIETARVDDTTLGFEAPSLFLARRTSHPTANMAIWTRPENDANVSDWNLAAGTVTPFLQGWLGVRPRSSLTILDLPEEGDIPFETGSMLATPVRDPSTEVLEGVLAHALTHAWVMSPRAWLSEGVAHFMGTLWMEKQQGRERALETLNSARTALALAEPESPGASDGQPLTACISPVYYRAKAAYVLWMLRDVAGDATLSAALRAYDPDKDTAPDAFEKLVEQAGQRKALGWFFEDWVYKDMGLPDLAIESVFPSTASPEGNYLVAVNVANNGYAAVEAPVRVTSGLTTVTQRVVIAARGKAVQRILIQGAPTEVRLNDGTIPESQATSHIKMLGAGPTK